MKICIRKFIFAREVLFQAMEQQEKKTSLKSFTRGRGNEENIVQEDKKMIENFYNFGHILRGNSLIFGDFA